MKGISLEASRYQTRLISVVGCICCVKDKVKPFKAELHYGDVQQGCHMRAIPLCSLHKAQAIEQKQQFHAKYGKQADLQAECNRILDRSGKR